MVGTFAVEFAWFVVPDVHVSVFENFSAWTVLNSSFELTCVVLTLCYFESSVSMFFAMFPLPDILRAIGLNLLSVTLFEPVRPVTFIDHIDRSAQNFDHPVAISFVVLELPRVDILTRLVLVSPADFFPLSRLVDDPPSVVEFTLIVPYYCSLLVQDERDAISVFFYTESGRIGALEVDAEPFESFLGEVGEL